MNRIEALADAIINYSGYNNPESEAYKARNPGLLKVYTFKHLKTENAVRIFKSALDGYQALLFDLSIKCHGKSRTRLKPTSTLHDLIEVYGHHDLTAQYVAKFLRRALCDEKISESTQLSYFIE